MLSIVIVNYNTRAMLQACLSSVRDTVADAQIIVVDNASSDDSVAMVRRTFPEVILVELPKNVGFAAGNNAGLKYASGDPILLLNSDTVVLEGSLQQCVDYLESHPQVGALSARLLGADGQRQQSAHPYPSVWNDLRFAFRRPVAPANHQGITHGWLMGAALFLRRQAFEQVGGTLDEGTFMYWEDADLSIRLHKAGWLLAVHPDATIWHYGGASGGGQDNDRRSDLQAWYDYGQLRWYRRHRPLASQLALYLLEWHRVVRMTVQAMFHEHKTHHRRLAGVLVNALLSWPLGRKPPRPGQKPKARNGIQGSL